MVCLCAFSQLAIAQTGCQSGSGSSNAIIAQDAFSQSGCDGNYRDEELNCEGERTVWGACPSEPQPHKRTEKRTFKDLSPYLWYSIPHPTEQLRKYDGNLYRGSAGDFRQVNQLVSAGDAQGENRFAACVHQIEIRGNPDLTVRERAKLIRLQLDNCANQYILNAALYPNTKEDARLLVARDRCEPPTKLTAAEACQPLNIHPASLKNEYNVSTVLEASWTRMLQYARKSDAPAGQSYKGYIPKQRNFGPFSGLLQGIFNVVNNLANLTQAMSQLSNLSNLGQNLSNIGRTITDTLKNQFNQMRRQIMDIPRRIMSSFQNIQELVTDLPGNMMDSFNSISSQIQDLPQRLAGLQDLPQNLMQSVQNLPQILQNLTNIGPMLQDLPQTLSNLQQMIPNFENITNSVENVGSIVDNLQSGFPDTLNALENLPGQMGGAAQQAVEGAAGAFAGIPDQLGNIAENTTVSINNPVPDIGNNLGQQYQNLVNLNNRLGNAQTVADLGRGLSDIGAAARGIPSAALATGGLVQLDVEIGGLNTLNQTLGGNSIGAAIDPANLQALGQLAGQVASLQQLQSGLLDMRQQMLRGAQFDGLDLPALDSYIANVQSLTGMFRQIDMSQLSGLMNDVGRIQRSLTQVPLNTFNRFTNGVARNVHGITNLSRYGSIVQSMPGNIAGSLGINTNINFGSFASRMGARKEIEVHPSVPEGTVIANPIAPPANFPNIRLSQLASFPYEEIIDPVHPFSPRYHYYVNDRRGYSHVGEKYSKDAENNVFCAGEREDDPDTEVNEQIPVDVLEFRRKKFEDGENSLYDGVWQRLYFNQYCYENDGPAKNPCEIKLTIFGFSVTKDLPCFTCFNLKRNKKTHNPPCSTNYQGKDRNIIMSPIKGAIGDVIALITSIPGVSSYFEFRVVATDDYLNPGTATIDVGPSSIPIPVIGLRAGAFTGGGIPNPLCLIAKLRCPAACSMMNIYRKTSMKKLCRKLREPYTPLNKLKMRYAREDEPPESEGAENQLQNQLPSGALEGMMHKEYFKHHMPYPRLWDTGASIQQTAGNAQDPRDQNGQYTAVVGVGREAILEDSSSGSGGSGGAEQDPEPRDDERCAIGGWGETSGGVVPIEKLPDPVSSWTELKLYQMNTLRNYGINCIGRYERLFKPHAQEDHVLNLAGGTYIERSDSCAVKTGAVEPGNTKFKLLYRNFPRSWRGYAGDPGNDGDDAFPKFPGESPSLIRGLDNAKVGDILIFPEGTDNNKPGLPILSYVKTVNLGNNCASRGGCYVTVIERNAGKWPDTCGNTDALGIESNRQIYRPGTLPNTIRAQISQIDIHNNIDCRDNDLQHCELAEWGNIELYRIREDAERGGNLNPIEESP